MYFWCCNFPFSHLVTFVVLFHFTWSGTRLAFTIIHGSKNQSSFFISNEWLNLTMFLLKAILKYVVVAYPSKVESLMCAVKNLALYVPGGTKLAYRRLNFKRNTKLKKNFKKLLILHFQYFWPFALFVLVCPLFFVTSIYIINCF